MDTEIDSIIIDTGVSGKERAVIETPIHQLLSRNPAVGSIRPGVAKVVHIDPLGSMGLSKAVIPKVGDIAPLGTVEGWKGAVESKGALGGRWKIMEHIGGGA
ncbi:hypothetical protein T12_4715 [Trichinella patagoniensis]|uniref:Uncharacterized protein n=1 Tax=Trichinella patagoniensis TaxID=990121 RepID=A0A0V0ZJD0_9BILA|nr:hypothetical protein T12_4715 [Trichinella patagoniensis]